MIAERQGSPFDNECCADMVKAKADIAELKADSREFREFIKEMRDAMTYRLPLWATILITTLAGALGWALK